MLEAETSVEIDNKNSKSKYVGFGTNPAPGTRDFLPIAKRELDFILNKMSTSSKIFGYEEYDSSIFEPIEMYEKKSGSELCKQMYRVIEGGNVDNVKLALRPEMTPTLARMFESEKRSISKPVRWFSIPRCYRYETQTRGRLREFFQWNADIIGVKGITAEAEVFACIVHFLQSCGLTNQDVTIRYSSRKLLQAFFDCLGVEEIKFPQACNIIDKLDKFHQDEIVVELKSAIGIEETVITKILDALQIKDLNFFIEKIDAIIDKVVHNDKSESIKMAKQKLKESSQEMIQLQKLCTFYGISGWIEFDPSIIRGLSYYTGVVFEGYSKTTSIRRAVCGGGRYDDLLSMFGGESEPAVGFGMGDVVIAEVLKELNLLPDFELYGAVEDVVVPFNEQCYEGAVQVASLLRSQGRKVVMILDNLRLKQAYSYADKIKAERVLLVAPTEWQESKVKVKYLREKVDNVAREELLHFASLS